MFFDNIGLSFVYAFCDDHESNFYLNSVYNIKETSSEQFSFTLIGDDHLYSKKYWNETLYKTVINNIVNDKPDFHFSMGDMLLFSKYCIDDPTIECCNKYACDVRRFIPENIPLLLVIGNWEATNAKNSDGSDNVYSKYSLSTISKHLVKPSVDDCFVKDGACVYYTFVRNNAMIYHSRC
ncbi:hypothetical protein [Heterosigma akashiwo virus 01]|jgi:hypothetical protein|uniref:Calcineurin-like phosphoesterase domain-containing protein n=1 Tax=Heterosigma akashiwo virus 01 TaxID=97195 RepID=A0A1C9C505_HAV01|nr:hypothetical protein D1R72_gp039 [Heterosigma akashiwo virus 01]AOM63370.1 hypothetical protein [Heterosigma akashiwo virus 01]